MPAILILSVAQAGLGQFVAHGVPLFLRAAGQPSHVIGLVYLASLPFILNVVWAPVIDRFGAARHGHYRGWLLGAQLAAAGALYALSFADPAEGPFLLIALVVLVMTVTASQDAALSGLMVRGLSAHDRARGSSARTAGAALAGVIVGAFVLYLLGDLGWAVVVRTLSACALAAFVFTWLLPLDRGWRDQRRRAPGFLSQLALFKTPAARRLMVVEIFTGLGLALTFGLKSIILVDAGFDVGDAALLSMVAGGAVGVLAVVSVRPLIDRFGGMRVLAGIAMATAVYCAGFGVVFLDGFGLWPTAIYVLIANALTFAAVPASRAILLGICAEESAATDFSAFNSMERVFLLLFGGGGAVLADQVGFSGLLWMAAGVTLVGAGLALRFKLEHTVSERRVF